jgi:hypothetical protein
MSAPARACETALAASHARVASLSTSWPTTLPQWPWLVYSQLQTSVTINKCGLHDSIWIVRAGGLFILGVGESENDDAADAEALRGFAFADEVVDGHLELVRHGTDLATHTFAGANKKRQYELGRF